MALRSRALTRTAQASRNRTEEIQGLQEQNDKVLAAEADKRKESEAEVERLKERIQKLAANADEERAKARTVSNPSRIHVHGY